MITYISLKSYSKRFLELHNYITVIVYIIKPLLSFNKNAVFKLLPIT